MSALPGRPREVTTADLRLFVSHLCWLVEHQDIRADALLELLSARFSATWPGLKLALVVDQPEQLKAEIELENLLLHRDLTRAARRLRWASEPAREVDWALTALESAVNGPGRYANLEYVRRPDQAMRGALAALATRWAAMLRAVGRQGREDRIARLDGLAQRAATPGASWSAHAERRLRHLDPECSSAILAALSLWGALRGQRLAAALLAWASTQDLEAWAPENQDNLFEWTGALGVARAAQAAGWAVSAWRGLNVTGGYPDLIVSQGELVCRVSKGYPRDGRGDRLTTSTTELDHLATLIGETGNKATGSQPDIVLTFWRTAAPMRCVTYLADAKRNHGGDGKRYLALSIAKGLVYARAYGALLTRNPRVTLFFYRAVERVAGVKTTRVEGAPWREEVVEALQARDLPEVMAFDLRHVGCEGAGLAWDASALRVWFCRLAREADRELRNTPE